MYGNCHTATTRQGQVDQVSVDPSTQKEAFLQRREIQIAQHASQRAAQRSAVDNLSLMSIGIFLVGMALNRPLLGAAAGGYYFWSKHPEGGKKTSGRRTEGPAQMSEKERSFRYGKGGGVSHHVSCPPGMFDPGTGICTLPLTDLASHAKAMEGMTLGEKMKMLGGSYGRWNT